MAYSVTASSEDNLIVVYGNDSRNETIQIAKQELDLPSVACFALWMTGKAVVGNVKLEIGESAYEN